MYDNKFYSAHLFVALMVVATTVSTAFAQFPRREPTPNDTLVSPEVLTHRGHSQLPGIGNS